MEHNTPNHLSAERLAAVNQKNVFANINGIYLTECSSEHARGQLDISENSMNPIGTVHGGALATLADTVAGSLACADGLFCVTTNCSMEFLSPGRGRVLTCVAAPVKMGRKLRVVRAEITDDNGRIVATGTFTFYMSEHPQKI